VAMKTPTPDGPWVFLPHYVPPASSGCTSDRRTGPGE
jgi:hypothetical protein